MTGIDIPGEAGYHYASAGKYRGSRAGDHDLWTVFSDYTGTAGGDGKHRWSTEDVRVTPHFGVAIQNQEGKILKEFSYPVRERNRYQKKCLEQMREISGKGSSQKDPGTKPIWKATGSVERQQLLRHLPRSAHKYISSFLGFAPANDPQVLAVCIVHDPQGIYYGGTVCAPVVRTIFENILPYLGIEKTF